MAKLVHDAEQKGKVLDLDQVWRLQRVPVSLENACLAAAEAANHAITSPPAGFTNMSEWAKKQACWASLQKHIVPYGNDFGDALIHPEDAKSAKRAERKDKEPVSGVEAQTEVVRQGGEHWSSLLAFGTSIRKLSPKEVGILQACAKIPTHIPSEKQCVIALGVADRMEQFYPT